MKNLYVIGIGPGDPANLTIAAKEAVERCEVIIGYTVYTDLLRAHYPEKTYISTPMRQEVKRCHMAFEEAAKGKKTAMVCSGDAGVYGMAGLLYEIGEKYPDVRLLVVPGITAATAGAAVLGAPLMHDFAVISLSDLLTPWETIEKRLEAAAMADFVISLYNPSSRKRTDYLQKACDIMLRYKAVDTVCGIVRNIGREGEACELLSLEELRNKKVDMFTTVYIGNRETTIINQKMVTPRGYQNV